MTHFIYATDFDAQLRKRLKTSGILLIVIGAIGILLPQAVSVILSVLIASLLLVSGLVVAWSTWYSYRESWLAWLKPFILVLLGLLIAFHPAAVAAVLGLLLMIYFLLDGFASVSLALDMRPLHGWGWLLVNGMLSLVLGIVFLVGWPFSSVWLVGVLVGISLVFDGIALLALASGAARA